MTDYHGPVKDKLRHSYDASAIATPLPDTVSVLAMDGMQQMGIDPDWLKAELDRPGRSQSGLARFMKLAPEQVNRIVNRKRQLKAHEADQIRDYLLATATQGDATLARIAQRSSAAVGLPIKGVVEAGSWREVAFSDVDMTEETLPAPRALVEIGAFALRVSGPSMDRLYRDGTYVIVQPWHGGPMPIGRRVVVERARPDGLVETTVKELTAGPTGELELWPRSTHPAHQQPVAYKGDGEGVTVRLVGVVIAAYQPE